MNKTELMKEISKSTGVDRATVKKVVNAFIEIIKNKLLFGIDVNIMDFVNFRLIVLQEQTITNPMTKEAKTYPKRYKVKMELPRAFKEKISKKIVY